MHHQPSLQLSQDGLTPFSSCNLTVGDIDSGEKGQDLEN